MNVLKTAIQRATNRIDAAEHVDVQRAALSVEQSRADLLREWAVLVTAVEVPDAATPTDLWAAKRRALRQFETAATPLLQDLINRETEEVGDALIDLTQRHQDYLADELRRAGFGIQATSLPISADEREGMLASEIEESNYSEYLRDLAQDALLQIYSDLGRVINTASSTAELTRLGCDRITATMKSLRESYARTVGSFSAVLYRENAETLIQSIRGAV